MNLDIATILAKNQQEKAAADRAKEVERQAEEARKRIELNRKEMLQDIKHEQETKNYLIEKSNFVRLFLAEFIAKICEDGKYSSYDDILVSEQTINAHNFTMTSVFFKSKFLIDFIEGNKLGKLHFENYPLVIHVKWNQPGKNSKGVTVWDLYKCYKQEIYILKHWEKDESYWYELYEKVMSEQKEMYLPLLSEDFKKYISNVRGDNNLSTVPPLMLYTIEQSMNEYYNMDMTIFDTILSEKDKLAIFLKKEMHYPDQSIINLLNIDSDRIEKVMDLYNATEVLKKSRNK